MQPRTFSSARLKVHHFHASEREQLYMDKEEDLVTARHSQRRVSDGERSQKQGRGTVASWPTAMYSGGLHQKYVCRCGRTPAG